MTYDLAFIHRVYRETAWFTAIVALYLYGGLQLGAAVWAGLLAGAAVALGVLAAFEFAVMAATADPARGRPWWLSVVGLAHLPVLAVVLYLCLNVWRLDGVAIAGGVTMPMFVGAMKAVGAAWGRWARGVRGASGADMVDDERRKPEGDSP